MNSNIKKEDPVLEILFLSNNNQETKHVFIPLKYAGEIIMQTRLGEVIPMHMYTELSSNTKFTISGAIDKYWEKKKLSSDDRYPRLIQHIQCTIHTPEGSITIPRTEVELQNKGYGEILLKVGHKTSAIVKFNVLDGTENNMTCNLNFVTTAY